jgi:hypothetical protein
VTISRDTPIHRWLQSESEPVDDDVVESCLTGLAGAEHVEPVLVEMEARAAEHGFPIVGRATGRFVELAARAVSARRVMERCRVPFRRHLVAPEVR